MAASGVPWDGVKVAWGVCKSKETGTSERSVAAPDDVVGREGASFNVKDGVEMTWDVCKSKEIGTSESSVMTPNDVIGREGVSFDVELGASRDGTAADGGTSTTRGVDWTGVSAMVASAGAKSPGPAGITLMFAEGSSPSTDASTPGISSLDGSPS